MVYHADSNPAPYPPPVPAPSLLCEHDVIVPVYLRVRVSAEDDLHAEMRAIEAIRSIDSIPLPGGTAHLLSIISPIVNHPNLPPPA